LAAVEARVAAVMAAARHHGAELDRAEFRVPEGEATPSPAALVAWLRGSGLWARALRLRWRQLLRLQAGAPVVLLFRDGTAGLLVGVDAARQVVWLRDPRGGAAAAPVAVDELRLGQVWAGEAILVRRRWRRRRSIWAGWRGWCCRSGAACAT
jgi:ATP-binding cassette subfamily B protein